MFKSIINKNQYNMNSSYKFYTTNNNTSYKNPNNSNPNNKNNIIIICILGLYFSFIKNKY